VQVRKPAKGHDTPDDLVPCCLCQAPGEAYNLSCHACQSSVPWCIATGRRMQLQDWTACPHCQFPASLPAFQHHATEVGKCPLCDARLDAGNLGLMDNPLGA
jgi:WD repeat-containing protein 19